MNKAREFLHRVALAHSWDKLLPVTDAGAEDRVRGLWKEVEDYLGQDESLDEETQLLIQTRDALACLVNYLSCSGRTSPRREWWDGIPEQAWILSTLGEATEAIDNNQLVDTFLKRLKKHSPNSKRQEDK